MQPATTQTPQNSYVSKMRERYPESASLDDVSLAKIVREKDYADMDEQAFFAKVGISANTQKESNPILTKDAPPPLEQKTPNPYVTKMREKYPMYPELDDFALAKAVKERDYADMNEKEFFTKVALDKEFETAQLKRAEQIQANRPKANTGIEFIDNNLVNDFTLGAAKNLLDYSASAIKGVGKIGGALGFDKFEEKAKAAQAKFNKASQRADKSIDNEYVALAGEMLGDPLNLTPAGVFTKGTKAARIAKSMAGGAVVGTGTMAAKNYGDDTMTQDEKNLEMGIGAGFVSALNGIIAGVTKGRVTSAINDAPDLEAMRKNPEAYGVTPEEAEQVAATAQEHLKNTKQPKASEELGLTKQPTELDQIDNGFKALADEMLPNKENEILPRGMNEPKEIVPEQVAPKPELSKQQQLLNAEAEAKNNLRIAEFKHSIDQPMEASVFETQAQHHLDEAQRLKDDIAKETAEPQDNLLERLRSESEMPPPPQEVPTPAIEKPRVGEPEPEAVVKDGLTTQDGVTKTQIRKDDGLEELSTEQLHNIYETQTKQETRSETAKVVKMYQDDLAKNPDDTGAKNALDWYTSDEFKKRAIRVDGAMNRLFKDKAPHANAETKADVTDMNVGDIKETSIAAPYAELLQHPRLEELLTKQQDVLAKDIRYPNRQTQAGAGRELDGYSGTTKHAYDPAQYEKNYDYDFMLTKQDVKNIRAGKIDEDIVSKLENDLGVFDNHPDWNKQTDAPMSADDWAEANTLFTKGADNLAVGTFAGVEQDENGSISFDAEKFIIGLGGYTAVKAALKNKTVQGKLKEYAQKAVDTVDMNPAVYKENGLNAMGPVKSKEQKEMRGIFNVQNNGKNSTNIYKDDEFAESYIKYERGKPDYVDKDGKSVNGFGALHIDKHIGNDKNGWVSEQELLNIGNAIRNTKPVVSKQGGRMYEYHNSDNVRFRAVVGDKRNGERTISFYSNRKAGFGNDSQNYIYNQPLSKETPAISKETEKTFDTQMMSTEIEPANKSIAQEAQNVDELFISSSKFSTAKDTTEKSYKPLKQTINIDGGDKIVGVQKEAPDTLVIRDKNGEYATIDKKLLDVKTSEDGVQTISYKGASDETNPNILMANGSNAFGGGLGGGLIGGLEDTDGNYIPDSWNWRNASLGALAGMGVGHFAKAEGTGMFGGKAFTTTYNKFKAGKLPNASALPDETKLQLSQRKFQDKFNRVKQLINVKADINKIDDAMNPYQAEELMHGRVEDKIRELETKTVTPILEKISKANLTTDKVDEYLWARHAPERNAKMLENHGKENGSGMSDAEAYTIINRYANNKAMQDIANDVYAMNRDRLKYIHSEGLESEDFIKMLDANYDNYVPLRREFAGEETISGTGKGFDIAGRETKKAKGSDRKVESPLIHSVLAYEETIVRAEKNQVGKAFLEFTKEFPDESLYSVKGAKHIPQQDESGAIVGMSPNYKTNDNVFHVKVDGKVQEITIHDPALATAFKNLNSQQMSSLLAASQKAVRVIAGLSTSYNPEFVVTNFTRDIQTAMVNMPDGMKANRATVIKEVMPAMQGIYASLRDGSKNEWSTLFEEMRREGGTTGWHESYSVLDMKKSTQAIINKYEGKVAPAQAFKEVLNYVNDVNGAVENASRLVAYKMAKESGKTNKQAASIAKNLTVNFNRKGEMGAGLNAAYMFYNASIQGSTRMVQQLATSKTSQALVVGIAGVGVGLDMYNRSQNAEAYALIDDYIKDTNYIFMHKDGTYNSLKLPYGYNVFKATGDLASKMYHGEMEASKIPKRILSMTVNAFSPIGVDAESVAHTLAPTVVKPFVEIDQNKNFFGGKIAPEQNPFEPEKPDSQNYFKSVNPLARVTAQKLNQATGGNMYEKGVIDVSPESIEHVIEFATGGLGKLVIRTGTVVDQALDKDKKVDMNKVPFLRNVYGVPREKAETNIIYKMYKESGGNNFSPVERSRFIKWTDAALEKKDINKEQAKKLKSGFTDNQGRLDFANKYNLQSKDEYQNSEPLQDAGRNGELTKQQRKELLKEDK